MPPQPACEQPPSPTQAVRGRFKRARASRDRSLAGTNDNPVLIAVLAAFIGTAQDHRAPHRRRQGPGVIGATEPADLDDAPAGGASTKASMPRKRTWWALPSVSGITA
jgi:hypothetical protein